MSEYNKVYFKQKRRDLIKRMGDKCALCGSRVRLQLHHKKPILSRPRPNKEALRSTKNKIVLCEKCHKKLYNLCPRASMVSE